MRRSSRASRRKKQPGILHVPEKIQRFLLCFPHERGKRSTLLCGSPPLSLNLGLTPLVWTEDLRVSSANPWVRQTRNGDRTRVNPPKCTSGNFVNFLISTYQVCSCTEASRCLPAEPVSIAHDSVKRLLERQPHHTGALYEEAQRLIRANEGVLVIDDITLDKPYSHQIELVTRHWSGKHHRVVQGINLISTIWTDGSAIVPVDFRIYCPDKDGKNKNDHFRDMLRAAKERKFQPGCVIFDSWYSSIANLKLIRTLKWHWCTRLKSNRLVDPDNTYNRSVSEILDSSRRKSCSPETIRFHQGI